MSMTGKAFIQAAETSAAAIGALSSKLSQHPLRRVWGWHSRVEATVSAAAMNGMAVQKDRLLMRLADLDIPMIADAGAESRALTLFTLLASIDREAGPLSEYCERYEEMTPYLKEDADIVLAALRASDMPTAMLAVADVGWSIRRERDTTAAPMHYAFPVWLHERRLAVKGPPLYDLLVWPARQDEDIWKTLFLAGVEKRAQSASEGLDNMLLMWRIWRGRLHGGERKRRSDSLADEILLSAFLAPCISPAWVAAHFDISLTAAGRQLQEMADLDILMEVTSRSSHKSYALADLPIGDTGLVKRKPVVIQRPEYDMLTSIKKREEEENLAARLDLLIDGIDASIRRTTAVMERLAAKYMAEAA